MALNETVPEVILAMGEGIAEKTSDFRIGTESTSVMPVRCTSHRTPSELPSELLWWQGWPSDESTCLPPMWPGFAVICGSSLLVLYSAMRGFSPGTPVFLSHQKPTFDLIRLDLICGIIIVK